MKHVFFDLDGTLTDPKEGFVKCIRYALSRMNIALEPEANFEAYIGPPIHHTFNKLFGPDLADEAISLYRERYASTGLLENRIYDGIHECLERLNGEVESMHVVTSKPTIYSVKIIRHFALDQYFHEVYGSNLDGSLSDKTELLAHVLEREGILPDEAVMIGDRRFDMSGAQNHGIRAVGVLWGYGSAEELMEAGADRLCSHPAEVADLVLA